MSPGRCALPSGMFSTSPTMPTAFTFALRSASVRISPETAAAPPMSPFMSSMPAAGLIEMPPVSKTTPLPTKATGLTFSRPPRQRMTTTRGGRSEPCDTPSSAPIFCLRRSGFAQNLHLDAELGEPLQLVGEFDRAERVRRLVDEVAGEA